MSLLLNIISVVATFIFGTGVIYLLLDSTIGRIKILQSAFEWHGFQVKDFVFLAIGAGLILGFTSFVLPH